MYKSPENAVESETCCRKMKTVLWERKEEKAQGRLDGGAGV